MTEDKPRRGRPPGSKTIEKPVVSAVETRCPVCNSTSRSRYSGARVVHGDGIAPDGKPYSEVSLNHCQCNDCGQHRIDRVYRFESHEM